MQRAGRGRLGPEDDLVHADGCLLRCIFGQHGERGGTRADRRQNFTSLLEFRLAADADSLPILLDLQALRQAEDYGPLPTIYGLDFAHFAANARLIERFFVQHWQQLV